MTDDDLKEPATIATVQAVKALSGAAHDSIISLQQFMDAAAKISISQLFTEREPNSLMKWIESE